MTKKKDPSELKRKPSSKKKATKKIVKAGIPHPVRKGVMHSQH